jgi:hypothetical protein
MPRIKPMDAPRSRREFERNLNLFVECVKAGRIHLPSNESIIQEILAVKLLPNRRIDLLTISEMVRLLANQQAHMDNHIEEIEKNHNQQEKQ